MDAAARAFLPRLSDVPPIEPIISKEKWCSCDCRGLCSSVSHEPLEVPVFQVEHGAISVAVAAVIGRCASFAVVDSIQVLP